MWVPLTVVPFRAGFRMRVYLVGVRELLYCYAVCGGFSFSVKGYTGDFGGSYIEFCAALIVL